MHIIIFKFLFKMNIIRLKVALIGDSNTGKSCIVSQLVKKYFNTTYQTTLGVDYSTFDIKIKDTGYTVQLHILDMTGFSIFRDLVANQIKECNCIIYVCDATNLESLNSLALWKESLSNVIDSNAIEILVSNKIDLERKIVVDETTLKSKAKGMKCDYFQVSALQAKGIDELFNHIAQKIYKTYIDFLLEVKKIS
jgi:small GTP-binding protein